MNLLKEYSLLLKEDKSYVKNYKLEEQETLRIYYETKLKYRNIENTEELKEVIESENAKELLKIEDYYFDELIDLTEEQFNSVAKEWSDKELREFVSPDNLNKLLEKEDISKQFKDCIRIYLKAESVCKLLTEKIKTENM